MLSRFFIQRPIAASVISIVIVIAGAVAQTGLPVSKFPEITAIFCYNDLLAMGNPTRCRPGLLQVYLRPNSA